MQKSLWQIRDSILQELRGGYAVDDDNIDEVFIEDKIHDYRKKLIEDYWEAKKFLDDSFYQKICCLDVKCEPVLCDGVDSGVTETYVELPELLMISGRVFIKYFGTVDWKNNFTQLAFNHNVGADRFTGSDPSYKRIGDRALLFNVGNIRHLCMMTIPDNPVELKCRKLALSESYPIPGSLVSKLEYDIIQKLIKPMMLMQPDRKNNAKDDLREPANRTA